MMVAETTDTLTTAAPVVNPPERTLHDKCDRCGFRAYYIAEKVVDGVPRRLYFCNHHGKQNDVALTMNDWNLWDFTEELYRKPEYKDDEK